ncbi:MAG: alpha/beta fold hydrolase [Bacteroidota bacterium]
MKSITKNIFLFSALILVTSCLRLDANLYNSDNTITEYYLDNYAGEVDFILDETYTIPDSLIHLFSLNSKTASEKESTEIKAIYIGSISKIKTDTIIVYCHGNRDHMDFYWQRAKLLANVGAKNHYGVLMMDYRGYGLSKGVATEEGLYADVDACLQWLQANGLDNKRLIMYGFSLGSAPATELTANPRTLVPSKLILEAPFASAAVMVQDGSKMAMPAEYFTDLKIDNAEEIKKVSQPFMWIHGTKDDFLSIETHGEVVYKNYKGFYSEAHRVSGGGHGSVPNTMGIDEYKKTFLKFIVK